MKLLGKADIVLRIGSASTRHGRTLLKRRGERPGVEVEGKEMAEETAEESVEDVVGGGSRRKNSTLKSRF